jgi:hypothetical protein
MNLARTFFSGLLDSFRPTSFRFASIATKAITASKTSLLGSVPLPGLCSTHLSTQLARHRNLSPLPATRTLSYALSGASFSQCAGRRQRGSRLAGLCRLCSSLDWHGPRPLPRRFLRVKLSESVYAFDSATIDLCLSAFSWAHLRRRKSAVKLHTLLDLRGSIPTSVYVTGG